MYECPNCAANLRFSIEHQNMFCEACGTVMSPYDVSKDADAEQRQEFEVTVFSCPQCGAQIVSEDNEAAAFCSFCGGSTILDSRIEHEKRPRYILPFKRSKKDCVSSFRSMAKRSIFSPGEVRDYKNIESFRGIYMPYWMYYAEKHGPIQYDVRKTISKYRGDYEYIDHYNYYTEADTGYGGVVFDASSSFSDNLSQAISPFDTNQLAEFTPSYLSGFYADTSDVDAEVYDSEAVELTTRDLFNKLNKDPAMKSYSTTFDKAKAAVQTSITNRTLIMLPVWFMSLRHKMQGAEDRVAYVAINGQTGEACADLPISLKKYYIGAGIFSAVFFIALMFFPALITPTMSTIISMIFVTISAGIFSSQSSQIRKWETGEADKGLMSAVARLTGRQSAAGTDAEGNTQGGKKSKKKPKQKAEWFGFTRHPFIVSLIITGAIMLIKPVSDLWYYGASLVMMVLVFFILTKLMKRYNALTTRPLPQFKRTGGDDSAKQAIRD